MDYKNKVSTSVGSVLAESGGRSPGFDYVRMGLAVIIVFFHSRPFMLGGTKHISSGILKGSTGFDFFNLIHNLIQPIEWAVVPSFFALSGFLVAASLMRSKTTLEFLMLRVLRIIPALFFESLLFAFIVGPLISELPLSKYFSSSEVWGYSLNIIGDIHYTLPGVFLHNPHPFTVNPHPFTVNSQLWTIPAEFDCYFLLVVVSLAKLTKFKATVPMVTVLSIGAALSAQFLFHILPPLWSNGESHVGNICLLLCFLAGVSLYIYRDRIPLNLPLFLISIAAVFLMLWNGDFQYLVGLPVAYATIYIGLIIKQRSFVSTISDYSYGIYLFGVPIQQMAALWFPAYRKYWLVTGFVGPLLITTAIAAISWRLLESPILEKRKVIIANCEKTLQKLTGRANAKAASYPTSSSEGRARGPST